MEFSDKECDLHSLPVNNVCTFANCEHHLLCDICLNIHPKEHKYIISLNAISNNIYEKMIENYEESCKTEEKILNDLSKEYLNKIEYDYIKISDYIFQLISKNKTTLIEKINNLKETYLEEVKMWTRLKFDYSKNYLDYINKNNISNLDKTEFLDNSVDYNVDQNNSIMEHQDDSPISLRKGYLMTLNKKNDDPFRNLLSTIYTVIDKQLYYKSNLRKGSEEDSVLLNEFSKYVKESINKEFNSLKQELIKICDERILFSDHCGMKLNGNIFKENININTNPSNIHFGNDDVNMMSPKLKHQNLNSFNVNKFNTSTRSPITIKKEAVKSANRLQNILSANSPYNYNNLIGNTTNNLVTNNILGISGNFQSRIQNFDPKTFTLNTTEEVASDKKGAWYSLEYIEDLDCIVCGYQTGEILIFKESDLTLIRTFRPRFKKIRKLIYSPENYSIFASYDDGYIVVIYLTNFKFEHYKMSTSQIYSMDIMQNYNILIFGGVDKKIYFSHIINLNKVLLFYDSKEGEIQSLLYDDKSDIIVSCFRKNVVMFFKYSTSNTVFKYYFDGNDCCGMVLKKFKEDSIFTCGYFLNLHHFKILENGKIEHVEYINLNCQHIYDFIKIDDAFILVTTYDEAKILLVDYENKKIVKTFPGYKGAMQLKLVKNSIYLTSHSESLKKITIRLN